MSRKILGPFSRVEGHLEIELERSDNTVSLARVNSPMFRGMETVMLNRTPMDALTIAPRICGICSVSQSVAAARALANLAGAKAPKNGQLVTNLILGTEMLSNHLTHFYMFFMPDFARPIYEDEKWFKDALRFKAETGDAQPVALEARSKLLHIMGILAGKWPHTLTIRPSGTTQSIKTTEKLKIKSILTGFRRFLEKTVYGISLEEILALSSEADLQNWAANTPSDLACFISFSKALNLNHIGTTTSTLLSGGGSPFATGTFKDGQVSSLPVPEIREDISHSFMTGPTIQSPHEGLTDPNLDKEKHTAGVNHHVWMEQDVKLVPLPDMSLIMSACSKSSIPNIQVPLKIAFLHVFGKWHTLLKRWKIGWMRLIQTVHSMKKQTFHPPVTPSLLSRLLVAL